MNWIVRNSGIRNRSLRLHQPVGRWVSPRKVNGVLMGVLFLFTKAEGLLALEVLEADLMLMAMDNKGMAVDLRHMGRMEVMEETIVVGHLLEIFRRTINHTVSHTMKAIRDDLQWSMVCHHASQFTRTTHTDTTDQICHLTGMTGVALHRLGLECQDSQAVHLQ